MKTVSFAASNQGRFIFKEIQYSLKTLKKFVILFAKNATLQSCIIKQKYNLSLNHELTHPAV